MPFIRVFVPQPTIEQKRAIAQKITDTVLDVLKMPDTSKDWTTIHFVGYEPEDLAVGGKLTADGAAPEYLIEYTDIAPSQGIKDQLAHRLTHSLGEALELGPNERLKINVTFLPTSADNVAVGGHTIRQLIAQQ